MIRPYYPEEAALEKQWTKQRLWPNKKWLLLKCVLEEALWISNEV
jgi:hypothetical protein